MSDKTKQLTTRELWARLFHASAVDQYLKENSASLRLPSFGDYITQLAADKGEKPEQLIKRSGLDRSFGYRLFSGARKPSRDTALQLAFGFALSPNETQLLLKAAHLSPLHPKVKRDAVIAYCLYHRMTLIDAQQTLSENALPLLGETFRKNAGE